MPFWYPLFMDFDESRVKVPLRIEEYFVRMIKEFLVMWSVLSVIKLIKMYLGIVKASGILNITINWTARTVCENLRHRNPYIMRRQK